MVASYVTPYGNLSYWENTDPQSLVTESAVTMATVRDALLAVGSAGGVVTDIAALDAITSASIGARYYMTNPGIGIEAITWEAYAGTGINLNWHPVDTVRASSKVNLDNFITAVAGTADLRFVVGGLAFAANTQIFYRFTATTGTKIPLGGLIPIVPSGVAGTGVSLGANGKITLASAPLASVNGCFSSEFTHYLIDYAISTSGLDNLGLRLRASGFDLSTSTYSYGIVSNASVTGTNAQTGSGNSYRISFHTAGLTSMAGTCDLYNPFQTAAKLLVGKSVSAGSAFIVSDSVSGLQPSTASHDGMSIFTFSATNMTGVIRIYGYNDN